MGSFSPCLRERRVKMKLLICLSLCLSFSLATSQFYTKQFEGFKTKYSKVYKDQSEEQERLDIFTKNLKDIFAHNSKKTSTWTMGVNEFADLTDEEFKNTYLGYKRVQPPRARTAKDTEARTPKDLPDSVNWVEAGVTTGVKNQGQCGSCWAFATTEQIESYHKIANDELLELSAQQVTSCTPNLVQCGGTGGCYGSVTELGFNYLQLFGHVLESDWPYTSGTSANSEECTYDLGSMTPAVALNGYEALPANDADAVMQHLAEVGPLAIAADASNWRFYNGGVFDGCSFDENISINHGIQLVGYGSEFSPLGVYDYWLVRNSWGTNWGEDGYIKMLRTSKCGTNATPMDGTACVGGPGNDAQTVCGMCGMLLDSTYPLGVRKF